MDELNFSVASLDGIDDNFKSLYTESKDGAGTYTLNVKGVKPEIEFNKIQNALNKERALREEKEKLLKAYGEHTPESILTMVSELESLKTAQSSTTQEDFAKRMQEAKQVADAKLQAEQAAFNKKIAELENLLKDKETENINMRLRNTLSSLYAGSGDPSGLDLAVAVAQQELKWNPDQSEFYTHDGLLGMKDWMEDSLFKKYPCLLKGSLGAGARESNASISSYEKFFNPNADGYSEDPNSNSYKGRVECYNKDPEAARGFIAKYEAARRARR
jgi:hypothetical protein